MYRGYSAQAEKEERRKRVQIPCLRRGIGQGEGTQTRGQDQKRGFGILFDIGRKGGEGTEVAPHRQIQKSAGKECKFPVSVLGADRGG